WMKQYGQEPNPAPEQLRGALFHGLRIGPLGLLRDMQDLLTLANSVRTNWTIVHQAAIQLKDKALEESASSLGDQTNRQIDWLCTRVKTISPEAVTVPSDVPAELKASMPKKPTVSAVPEPLWGPLVAGILTLVVG